MAFNFAWEGRYRDFRNQEVDRPNFFIKIKIALYKLPFIINQYRNVLYAPTIAYSVWKQTFERMWRQMKVTVKEWRVMSDHNKQLLLNAVATK